MRSKIACLLLIIATFHFTTSCVVSKNVVIVKGSYETFNLAKTNQNTTILLCEVYDKGDNMEIPGAIISMNNLNIVKFTDDAGSVRFEVPNGRFSVTVTSNGYKTLKTKPISFNSGTVIHIKFKLGYIIQY